MLDRKFEVCQFCVEIICSNLQITFSFPFPLACELNKYKQNKDLITLLKELDKEKQKNEDLMQHCRNMEERLTHIRWVGYWIDFEHGRARLGL